MCIQLYCLCTTWNWPQAAAADDWPRSTYLCTSRPKMGRGTTNKMQHSLNRSSWLLSSKRWYRRQYDRENIITTIDTVIVHCWYRCFPCCAKLRFSYITTLPSRTSLRHQGFLSTIGSLHVSHKVRIISKLASIKATASSHHASSFYCVGNSFSFQGKYQGIISQQRRSSMFGGLHAIDESSLRRSHYSSRVSDPICSSFFRRHHDSVLHIFNLTRQFKLQFCR